MHPGWGVWEVINWDQPLPVGIACEEEKERQKNSEMDVQKYIRWINAGLIIYHELCAMSALAWHFPWATLQM